MYYNMDNNEMDISHKELIESLTASRRSLSTSPRGARRKPEEEGGCGVVGFCCSEPVPGRHIHEPSVRMHNRGNGKGGGIAAVGLVPEDLGVDSGVLDDCVMIHVALLDQSVRNDLEERFVLPFFDVVETAALETVDDWRSVQGLEVRPPDVRRYFVRVKSGVLDSFIADNGLAGIDRRDAEDEFVNRNSFLLNREYYASLGRQRAFVMSHGRNIMILKVVGYAEAITSYYHIDDLRAHAWIAHQRYPTKGRVWHPGGAHPFAGINMALVHNGDFANYHSVTEYLRQRNIFPQFLTDTEVAALLFDLLDRTYRYPLEYIIEALAPTTELDFDRLPERRQAIYRAVQATHIHGSPDGPWFFIIARNVPRENRFQLLGITDTAMLRPQVFAFSDGEVQVGVISSEKQAIDALLRSLSESDPRICPVADRYWNARGGSYTDGGAFIFNLDRRDDGTVRIECTDKFGNPVSLPETTDSRDIAAPISHGGETPDPLGRQVRSMLESGDVQGLFNLLCGEIPTRDFEGVAPLLSLIRSLAKQPRMTAAAIEVLTLLNDRRYAAGSKKRSRLLALVRSELNALFGSLPPISDVHSDSPYRLVDFDTRDALRGPNPGETTLVIDASRFQPEGDDCDAALLLDAYLAGWKRFVCFGYIGQRFAGCGLGPDTDDVVIDVYGSPGDYLASGIDGLTIRVHDNAQDQVGQIIKSGKLVIFGDVGQAFMYGAKGGAVYVMGNAAGRPLINAVGKPRVVINGTCLDFLAESFMAGDPHSGGGFVVLNGVAVADDGTLIPLPDPYPGSNLFSLASGGAIFIRDPRRKVIERQLNGGKFAPMTGRDWELILPALEENERLFGIAIDGLLSVDGVEKPPAEVYRKISPVRLEALASGTSDVFVDDTTIETIIME